MAELATNVSDVIEIRCIQRLILFLSCLPKDGKLREVLERALALDEEPILSRLSTLSDPLQRFSDMRTLLESLWARTGLHPDEREIIRWQNSKENMEAAIRELKIIQTKLPDIWKLS